MKENDEELSRYAHELAEMSLSNGFDEKAYILKVLSELWLKSNGKDIDLVEDSLVDDFIKNLMDEFVYYSNTKDIKSLKNVMRTIRKIVSELYHDAETKEERNIILQELKILESMQ